MRLSYQPPSDMLARLIEIMERSKARKLALQPPKKTGPSRERLDRALGGFAN